MAKNLKLNIKNTQLAEVLKKSQKALTADEPAKKTKAAKPAAEPSKALPEEKQGEKPPEKKVVRARKAPTNYAEKESKPSVTEEVVAPKEEAAAAPEPEQKPSILEERPSLSESSKTAPPREQPSDEQNAAAHEQKSHPSPRPPSENKPFSSAPRQGEYKPYPPREPRPYPPREGESRPPQSGESRPYPPRDGERRPYPPRESRPYPPRDGSTRPYPPREQRPYPPREGESRPPQSGESRPYPPRDGERRPYPPREGGARPYPPRDGTPRPYPPRDGAPRPYPPREGGARPYPPREGGPPRPYTPREGGARPYPPRSGPPPIRTPLPPKEDEEKRKRRVDKPAPTHFDEDGKHKKAAPPSSIKRQSFSRVFDSRDRSGLRTGEDETWRRRRHKQKSAGSQEPVQRPKEVTVTLPVSVRDLAAQMKIKSSDVIQKLFLQGLPITANDNLEDPTTVALIGNEFGCVVHIDTSQKERLEVTGKTITQEIEETPTEHLITRPPVVTVMGHVDHGKTSIIDSFRKSNIVAGEAGAITQHIGAFQVQTKHGSFTVLDTPGHEAFSAIRARGANVTDIVVLVIAGDEGIKPQTEEAITKAKEADVPIIVAINKLDKPGFNAENVYRELTDRELLPEAWGGSVITVNCSAKTKEGIEQLGEMIAIQSEVLELTANPNTRARGTVLESELHRGLGPTATLLVQNGTLRCGDAVIFEYEYGRVKTMQDEHGRALEIAGPSTAVRVTGLSGVPDAGNEFISLDNEKEARKIAEERKASQRKKQLSHAKAKDVGHLLQQKEALKQKKVLNIILKADVGGSLEAVQQSLQNIPTEKVDLTFITAEVGQISESDIERAETSNALIVGFHTKIESHAETMIKTKKVKIIIHDVIYHLVDAVKAHMLSLLDKLKQENQVGEAKVLALFKSSQLGSIAGCQVTDGLIKRTHLARVFRENEQIWEGAIASLKRHQDDAKEVKKDLECGIVLGNTANVAVGDIIKTYEITYIAQEL